MGASSKPNTPSGAAGLAQANLGQLGTPVSRTPNRLALLSSGKTRERNHQAKIAGIEATRRCYETDARAALSRGLRSCSPRNVAVARQHRECSDLSRCFSKLASA